RLQFDGELAATLSPDDAASLAWSRLWSRDRRQQHALHRLGAGVLLDLGLSDGLGSAAFVAREIVGTEKLVDYSQQRDLLERFAERVGTTLANRLAELGGASVPALR
ncbi:MAG: hypothetical protein ACOCWF_02800, partial [Halochromatium sp.]